MTFGLGVFVVLVGLLYGAALLAPEPRSDAELDEIEVERGSRVAERFRQMDEQRRLTVRIGRIVLPAALVLLAVSLLADLVV